MRAIYIREHQTEMKRLINLIIFDYHRERSSSAESSVTKFTYSIIKLTVSGEWSRAYNKNRNSHKH